mmetsp:Transcript_64136/g.141343  ORF Transcript_64136/g.141343 Transcript_64136/m.141343 type:complete len:340 (-) Transcript_64136:108-1127(-)
MGTSMKHALLLACAVTFAKGVSSYSEDASSVSLVQTQVRVGQVVAQHTEPHDASLVQSESPTALLNASMPIIWLHVPKAGTSFINTFIHTPGVCPGIPVDAVLNRTTSCQDCNNFNDHMTVNFCHAHDVEYGDKEVCPILAKWGGHRAIGAPGEFERHYKGKGVMMMRQPEQRLISSWEHEQHDWPEYWHLPPADLQQYSEALQGCTVRMLTHDEQGDDSACGDMLPLKHKDVELAKKRLDQFAFVGLTEEWDLSICLFRTMFGGLCYGSDFQDIRLPKGKATALHDTSPLNGFVDRFDGELYVKAQEIFAAEMKYYGVNESSCKACWDHADLHWTQNT